MNFRIFNLRIFILGVFTFQVFQSSPASALSMEPEFKKPAEYDANILLNGSQYQISGFHQNDLSISAPLFRTDEHVVSASLLGHDLIIEPHGSTTGTIPSRPDLFQSRLLGASYYHHTDDEEVKGMTLSLGSASDQPFTDSSVTVADFTGVYRFSSATPHRAWLIMLNISNDRPGFKTIPLPGVAYIITNPTGSFNATLGFPYIRVWTRQIRKTKAEFLVFPWAGRAAFDYSLYDNLHVVGALEADQQVYMRKNRNDLDARFFYDEKRISTGLRFFFADRCFIELNAGYAFNRSLFEGLSVYELKSNREMLKDESYIRTTLRAGI